MVRISTMLSALLAAVLMASTAAGTLPIQSPDANTTTGDPVSGKRLFTRSCASCHFIPDPQIKRDRLWIEMLATTA